MNCLFREIDQYGFEREQDFDYESYEAFMSEYLRVLARRMAKWEKLMKISSELSRSRKGIHKKNVVYAEIPTVPV